MHGCVGCVLVSVPPCVHLGLGLVSSGLGVSSMSIFVLGVCVLGWCVSAHLRELGLNRFPLVSRAVPRAEVTHPPISFSWEPAWESE